MELETIDGKDRIIRFNSKEDSANPPELVIEQTPAELQPTADAYTRNGIYASNNYGNETALVVKDGSVDYDRRTYLKFDLSDVNAIHDATLRVYGGNTQDTTAVSMQIYGVDDDSWSETGITWSNASTSVGTLLDTITVNGTIKYYTFDVTELLAADHTVTFMLQGDGGNRTLTWNSRESASHAPVLIVK